MRVVAGCFVESLKAWFYLSTKRFLESVPNALKRIPNQAISISCSLQQLKKTNYQSLKFLVILGRAKSGIKSFYGVDTFQCCKNLLPTWNIIEPNIKCPVWTVFTYFILFPNCTLKNTSSNLFKSKWVTDLKQTVNRNVIAFEGKTGNLNSYIFM